MHSTPGAGSHGNAPLRTGHGSPLRHGRPHRGPLLAREKDARLKSVLVAGVYPWNDPAWRYRLHGTPYPYFYYRPVSACELISCGIGKKLRWRRVFRCH